MKCLLPASGFFRNKLKIGKFRQKLTDFWSECNYRISENTDISMVNYNPPRAGKPHSASVGNSTPKGTKAVAYAHTHPNSNVFSGADIRAAENLKIDAYVVGPNLELQRYSLSSASTTNIGGISPIALTDAQRSSLVTEFQVSWDAHIAAGCDFDCGSMTWPTP